MTYADNDRANHVSRGLRTTAKMQSILALILAVIAVPVIVIEINTTIPVAGVSLLIIAIGLRLSAMYTDALSVIIERLSAIVQGQ